MMATENLSGNDAINSNNSEEILSPNTEELLKVYDDCLADLSIHYTVQKYPNEKREETNDGLEPREMEISDVHMNLDCENLLINPNNSEENLSLNCDEPVKVQDHCQADLPLHSTAQQHSNKRLTKANDGIELSEKETPDVQMKDQALYAENLNSMKDTETADCNQTIENCSQDELTIDYRVLTDDSPLQSDLGVKISYNFDATPFQITGAWETFSSPKNYTKGCKWSPDGTCILTNSNDNTLRIFNLPQQFYEKTFSFESVGEMSPILSMRESELIYDYCWYPKMTSSDANTCFLVSCSASNPVHMWNAYTGQLHCTYRPYNHMDDVIPAYSLAFNPHGDKLYCGFNKMIKVFDVAIPGRECITHPTFVKNKGQTGMISCIAVNPIDEKVFAAGSYSKTIGIYSEPKGKLMFMLKGQMGGLTYICFSADGNQLYSGGRKDPEILCWDLRNPGEILFSLKREVVTNQRIYFDVDLSDNYIVSGNNSGTISIWEVDTGRLNDVHTEIVIEPKMQFQGHNDTVNGVSFHPTLPVFASCSGQRKFYDPSMDSESEDNSIVQNVYDNSLRLWWVGASYSSE